MENGMWRAQARVAEAALVMVGPAQPTAEEPKQLVARVIQRSAVTGTQLGVAGLQVHEIVETVHQLADARLAADPLERCGRRGGGRRGIRC